VTLLADRDPDTPAETDDLDFKEQFDPMSRQDWCELIKDIAAIANSGGGAIIVGVKTTAPPPAQMCRHSSDRIRPT